MFKGPGDERATILRVYAESLIRHNRKDNAAALVLKEIKHTPAETESAKEAANILGHQLAEYVSPDNKLLWTFLENRPVWDYPEERLISEMLHRSKKEELDRHYSRAEDLAKGKDPSRAYQVGRVFNDMKQAQRALPLLEYASEKAVDKELKRSALSALADAYLAANKWKQAQGLLPKIHPDPAWRPLSDLYMQVAIAAAQNKENKIAMRMWATRANLNPSNLEYMDDLARRGLKEDLIAFYRTMQKKMPTSELPARALAILERI